MADNETAIFDFGATIATAIQRGKVKGAFTIKSSQPIINRTFFFEHDPVTGDWLVLCPEIDHADKFVTVIKGALSLLKLVYEEAGMSLSAHVDLAKEECKASLPPPKERSH